jgi:hypothetical protein
MENNEIPKECNTVDVKKVTESAVVLADQYDVFTVSTDEEYENGADHLKGIKDAQKTVEAERKKITDPLFQAKKNADAFFKQFTDKLALAESNIKAGLLEYAKKKEAEQREAQRIANEKAEKERKRLARLQENAEKRGDTEKADQFGDRAAATMPETVEQKTPPKVSGIATKEVWKYEITDPSLVPDQYKVIDEKRIAGVVRSLKGDTEIPGVRVYAEKQMASSGR